MPEPPRAPVSFRVMLRSAREACIAGTNPKRMPVPSASSRVKPITVQSSVTAAPSGPMRGMLPGFTASNARTPSAPITSPKTPPSIESSTLSVSSWRTMRLRPAPMAERMAISRARPVARASSRLATFAQAISSTQPTAPNRTKSAARTLRTMSCCIGSAVKLMFGSMLPGYRRLNSSPASLRAAFAALSETPGFRRAAAWK